MANRSFTQFRYSLEKMVVDLYAKVSFGAAGAPTLVYGKGITSISRTAAGKYTVLLNDTYQKLLMAKSAFVDAAAPASPSFFVLADNSATLAAPGINIEFNAAGVATDPGNGEIVLLQFSFSNSTAT